MANSSAGSEGIEEIHPKGQDGATAKAAANFVTALLKSNGGNIALEVLVAAEGKREIVAAIKNTLGDALVEDFLRTNLTNHGASLHSLQETARDTLEASRVGHFEEKVTKRGNRERER